MEKTIGTLVRQMENDYISGSTKMSKYVDFSMHDTIETIDAYLNSRHISGPLDAQGREKPFFNICTAAVNVWFRATDIDRKNITVRANKRKDWVNSFLATVYLREWMRKQNFGQFLNEWGRSLAKYGSSVVKFVDNSGGLSISVIPWNRIIVDTVDFDSNPVIEIIELTEAQLRRRIDTHGYNKLAVEDLIDTKAARTTLDRNRKDNKSDYYKLYEVHGEFPLEELTGQEADESTYVRQVHVVAFVGQRSRGKQEYDDFTLFAGREKTNPYMITHLIKEDGRVLSIGAVENLFNAQWMVNHSAQSLKNTLDISSRLLLQTADANLVGTNVLSNIENGDIIVHGINKPLSRVDNAKPDTQSWSLFSDQWRRLGNEINGISEAMLGASPKSGTAWRQTEAVLQESYSLFEIMTENKALQLEEMLRTRIIPSLRRTMGNAEEIMTTLSSYEINKIDSIYVKNTAVRQTNLQIFDMLEQGMVPSPIQRDQLIQQNSQAVQESLNVLGNKRSFAPDEINWKEQLKDIEWDLDIDITGEEYDSRSALTTLNTALQLVVQPGFDQNPRAKMLVGRILELTGAMSPVEYDSLPSVPTGQSDNSNVPNVPNVKELATQ